MTKINIVYDNIFEDVDIIAIPNEIVPKIEEIGQEFLYWDPPLNDSDYWITLNGNRYLLAETEGFIKWLNSNYCQRTQKAYIVTKNTNYCPLYKIINF